ncbi:MAG: exodeoxyribonuclease III, partial [Asgard group archaeon]|nr:exodeoxyribonuclease III [Asgard group archaeon]
LPIEREWIDQVIDEGYFDSFRLLHPDEKEKYSWWSYRAVGARERNVGWRLDYFFVSNNLRENVAKAYILDDVMGSDHCPVGLDLQFK